MAVKDRQNYIRDAARDRFTEQNLRRAQAGLESLEWESFFGGFLAGATAVNERAI